MRIKKFYDISAPLDSDLASWPGEEGFLREEKKSGEAVVSKIRFGSHTGTHIDAPKHFIENGNSIDNLLLSSLIGECHVLNIKHSGHLITTKDISGLPRNAKRVVFKTKNTEKGLILNKDFRVDYISLDKNAAQELVKRKVKLVGIDYLSIEAKGSAGHPVHKTLLKAGIIIIEGCNLKGIKPGKYELIALPLRIKDGDGSPARVILKKTK